MQTERVLAEDALKHLYDHEYNSVDSSLNSLKGSLSIKGDEAAKLISKLEERGLIESHHGKIKLTSKGRSYALRIIRIHRLWERYLADNTSVDETEWHSLAEDKEHQISSEDANLLAAKLGNPLLDPHGDPIPTESGDIPKQKGIHLNNLEDGKFATIIHIEDEPKEIFAQISAQGLYPGSQIRVIENQKERIRFEVNGDECVLAPVFASNILVVPILETEKTDESFEPLSAVDVGEEVEVVGLSRALRGQQRRRMLDFGIVPGTKIKPQLESLGGDPTAYEIRGTTIALRKNQSDKIFIRRFNKRKAV